MSTEVHISSLVVHGRPEGVDGIATAIGRLAGAEVHGASDDGKLVITLESGTEAEMLTGIDAINDIDGVLSIEQRVFRHPWSRDFFRLILSDMNNYL